MLHAMLFNTYEFIYLFVPIVLIGFYSIPRIHFKILFLTLASYFFYGFWNYQFIPLLLGSTLIDFFVGKKIHQTESLAKRRTLLLVSMITNLGVLGFFKYFNFFSDSFFSFANAVNLEMGSFTPWDIILPVGISFYTFQSMSYTIDVYRRSTGPYENFVSFAAYVSLFPQLVAGPIIRHNDLVPQLMDHSSYKFNANNFSQGLILFVLGLSKKVLIADRIGVTVDTLLPNLEYLTGLESWLCLLGYTTQLYFDFSGYSDMAIGLGKMMNLDFPINFNSPYKSKSITEFWQRWHMTLSSWLRDYLYISLGGNRKGTFKTYRNLFLTMLLGGLWHGANWTFVAWGAFHGSILIIERKLNWPKVKAPAFLKMGLTFLLVMIGWAFFRSPSISFAIDWIGQLFVMEDFFMLKSIKGSLKDRFLFALAFGLIIVFSKKNLYERDLRNYFKPTYAFAYALLLIICTLYFGSKSPFLYFQF
jgi:alginate O-acetyltransferase complex protein AlgI